ncbi:MAG: hypothetical protein MJB57_00205 [Gemmatimonadetes bacterium]|nr:hypothetical protein [Gemmatimonadota bacterium]
MRLRKLWACVGAVAVVGLAYSTLRGAAPSGPAPDDALYEIRNYHFDPANFDAFSVWATGDYIAYLREHLDVVGYWINTDISSEVQGADQDELGSANITWIIRWDSKAQRDERLPQVLGSDEWRAIFSSVPGGFESYRRLESKFARSLY